jgi:hypothetical protein
MANKKSKLTPKTILKLPDLEQCGLEGGWDKQRLFFIVMLVRVKE